LTLQKAAHCLHPPAAQSPAAIEEPLLLVLLLLTLQV
jgi:hypothetical protein